MWTAPGGVGSSPARYDVYDGTSPGFSLGTPVRSTTGTSTTVTGLKNGTTYYFVVTAVDVKGAVSGSSGEAYAEPTAAALASNTVPTPLIVSLAAAAAVLLKVELPGVKALNSGFRLLPASAYPDEAHAGHPDGLAVAGQFPGVDLLDGHGHAAAAKPSGTEHASQVPAAQHSSGQPAAEHPSSGEAAHQSVPWWEKTRAEPTRPS